MVLSVSFFVVCMRVQQYPVFPFCMNITYACLFSFERAFSTSHMRKRKGAGEEEIYLHREKPSLYLLPALADYGNDDAGCHTSCRP